MLKSQAVGLTGHPPQPLAATLTWNRRMSLPILVPMLLMDALIAGCVAFTDAALGMIIVSREKIVGI